MATIDVKDAADQTVAIEKPNANGRAAAASSRPVAISTEDKTALDAIGTSLAVMDDWDESDRAKVNLIVGQAGIAAGTGTDGATVPRVTLATNVGLPAGENYLGKAGGSASNPSASFSRPADTTAYTIGDMVANSTTAGSVTSGAIGSLTVTRAAADSCILRRLKLQKTGTTITNASFRVHLFRAFPGTVVGDNAAWSTSVSGVDDYIGAFDVTMDRQFSDGACGFGTPVAGSEITVKLASGSVIYYLIEARAAYTPTSGETFKTTLDDLQN